MLETDMRPTRYLLTLRYAQEFVREFFEQNPISQLGIIGMRDGLAQRISDMSGNPADHITKLQGIRETEPKGQASLQNAFDMSRAALYHAPTHTTREVLLLLGSLLSSDPGDIHQTITTLVSSKITCTVIGLAAQIAICKTLVSKTNPSRPLSESYNVALDDIHYRELIMRATIPPPIASNAAPSTSTSGGAQEIGGSTLLCMGFPSRITSPEHTLCACHSKPTQGGYLCSRCSSKVCALPSKCPICGLTLILSTHLARSYHHLFPLKNWKEVSWARAAEIPDQYHCFSCLTPFPSKETSAQQKRAEATLKDKSRVSSATPLPPNCICVARRRLIIQYPSSKTEDTNSSPIQQEKRAQTGLSECGRYECETCHSFFCLDCDIFCHEVLYNCPGCQSREGELEAARSQD